MKIPIEIKLPIRRLNKTMYFIVSSDENRVLSKNGKYMGWDDRTQAEYYLSLLNGKYGDDLKVVERNVVDDGAPTSSTAEK